jgi:hypothetical protein
MRDGIISMGLVPPPAALSTPWMCSSGWRRRSTGDSQAGHHLH